MARSMSTMRFVSLAGLLALAAPAAFAQAFSADYTLPRSSATQRSLVSIHGVRLDPVLHGDDRFAGGGLSLAAGQNWFAEVAVGRSLRASADPANLLIAQDALRLGGGYRWGDGHALSVQLIGGRSSNRLGLSVRYDWPRYFVRLSYDTDASPVPQDMLRFSAGIRF
jgi:hypothetical protein